MMIFDKMNAFDLPKHLFPNTDFDTALSRFYETQNEIAIAVSEYRYNHNLTQAALAEMLHVSQAMVSKYESGSYNISLKAAYELFDKLGMRFTCRIEDDHVMQQTAAIESDGPFSSMGANILNPVLIENDCEQLIA